jgi:hypothetical protein
MLTETKMDAMQQCSPDSPLMKAWNAYQDSDAFKDNLYWATTSTIMREERAQELGILPEMNVATGIQREQRAKGCLWGAFMAGFNATHMPPSREAIVAEIMKLIRPAPVPMAQKPTIDELEEILNSESDDAITINPDGTVSRIPPPTTVGAVVDAILRIIA